MNDTALRDVLHEVATQGVGPDIDVRVARVGAAARIEGRRSARHRWVVAVGALSASAVLVAGLVALLFAVTRPAEVVPAAGPGSLPDQIFPSRQHILTMEQAPIGRVALVYAGPLLGGVTSWVAVGADADEYRALAPASAHLAFNANVDVSPDGSMLVVGRGGAGGGDLRLEFIDARTGQSTFVMLPDDGAGGSIDGVSWSPDGRRLAVTADVVDGADPDGSSGQVQYFVVDVASGAVVGLPRDAVLAGEAVGWTPDGRVLLADGPDERGRLRLSAADESGVAPFAELDRVPAGFGRPSLSPDGNLLAGLVDPTPTASGDGSVWDLLVYDLATGEPVYTSNLSSYAEDETTIIGWRDSVTPVLSAVQPGPDGPGLIVAHDVYSDTQRVLVRAGVQGTPRYYLTSRVASDVLASGQIRDAQPPEQPWYDPRTLGSAAQEHRTAFISSLVLAVLIGCGLTAGRLRRRRPAG